MSSEEHSHASEVFNPASIARYAIIRVPIRSVNPWDEKLLVVARNNPEVGALACMKATSKTQIYKNSREKLAGAVLYPAGSVSAFALETVIQPNNLFPIPYSEIGDSVCVVGQMPADFHEKLLRAIKDSNDLTENCRRMLLRDLGQ